MALNIDYSDNSGLIIYANLYSATDRLVAFNPTTDKFVTVTGTNELDVVIVLEEISARPGFYTYNIIDVSNIPATVNGQFYMVEIFRATGSGFDRSTDRLAGTITFYWDGEKEVDVCGCEASGSGGATPQEIWEYSDRSLTEDLICPDPYIELECPDHSDEIDELRQSIEEGLEIINKTLEDIKNSQTSSPRIIPNTQTPRVNRGTGGQSDIRVT